MTTMDSSVRIIKKTDVTDLAGEKVMVDFDSGKYLMLKGAANDIWEMLEDGIIVKTIVANLLNQYEVGEAECVKSTISFIDQLAEYGIVSVE